MSDIDFVELDKAVNNLVNKNNAKPTAATPSQSASQSPESASHVSHKPAGRFMDVFHHSSDMMGKSSEAVDKPDTSAAPPPRKVLNPIYNDIKTPHKTSQPPPLAPPQLDENVRKNDWPDPIETATSHPVDLPTEEPIKETTPQPSDTSSLFLPDTKVEKRPLGGFNAENIENNGKNDDGKEDSLESEVPPPVNVAPATELPPELEADLVAIEEGGSVFNSAVSKENEKNDETKPELDFLEDDTPDEPVKEQASFQPERITTQPTPAPKPETTPPEKEKLSGLLAAGSIPQQYKTAKVASDASDPAHPIFFDADQYDKAPNPGAQGASRKTSAFQWVFIIVGLLLLGATLGAALFVFVSNS